jgi:hypothetical protein
MERRDEVRRDIEGMLQCIGEKNFQSSLDRIRDLAMSVRRRSLDPEALEAANRILHAANYLKRYPQRQDTYEPVLVRCIAQLRATLR